MPVLPEVGSTSTVLPGDCPRLRASIMATPIRSLTEASGLKNSSLATNSAWTLLGGDAGQAHQGRLADGFGDEIVDLAASRLFRCRINLTELIHRFSLLLALPA